MIKEGLKQKTDQTSAKEVKELQMRAIMQLRDGIKELGGTYTELAVRLEMSRQTVHNVLNGIQNNPTVLIEARKYYQELKDNTIDFTNSIKI